MRQRGAKPLVTEEPDESIAHVRLCGGPGGKPPGLPGRKMLKAKLAAFVEESLASTGPNHAFTATVVAALPALAFSKSATAATGVAVASKGSAAVVTAGALGIILGNLVYITWGFFGMWTAIRNARTLRVRRHMLKISALSYASIWAFIGLQGMNGILFWPSPPVMFTAIGVSWGAYIILLFILVTYAKLKAARVLEEDLGIRPAPAAPMEASALSRRRIWMCFAWTGLVAVVGSLAFLGWLHGMPWTSVLWGLPLVMLSHGVYVALFIKGVGISQSEDVFSKTAPCATGTRQGPSAHRISFLVDGGMGLLIAPIIWGLGLGILARDFTSIFWIGAVIVAVNLVTARSFKRQRGNERLLMFWALACMGVFIPIVIGLKTPAWAAELGWSLGPAYAWASAAIYFSINACFATSELLLHMKSRGWGRIKASNPV